MGIYIDEARGILEQTNPDAARVDTTLNRLRGRGACAPHSFFLHVTNSLFSR
jgi:hypothetical protein